MTFATISRITGRKLPRIFMEKVQFAFVLLLLGFMAYVTFFDVGRVGRDIGLINDEVLEQPAQPAQISEEVITEE